MSPHVRTVRPGWCDGGAGRLLVAAGIAKHRAHRVAHGNAELKAAARQRMTAGQAELDLGLDADGLAGGRCRSRPRGWAACWTRRSLERLQLLVVMRRTRCSMLHEPRREDQTICTRDRPQGSLHRPSVSHHTRLRARLVRKSTSPWPQTCASQRDTRANPDPVIRVRSHPSIR